MIRKSSPRKPSKPAKLPALPKLLDRKLYKTGQTRGADDDVIFQNRVSRSSTVLIPFTLFDRASAALLAEEHFQNGFIAIVDPAWYFETPSAENELAAKGLTLGENALVFYETRSDWVAFPPPSKWTAAVRRRDPLGGQYVARVPATTAIKGERVTRGFATSADKGAGIRVYEYANAETITHCRIQLEALVWLCADSETVMQGQGMSTEAITRRKSGILELAEGAGLLDQSRLREKRMLNRCDHTICPLCLEELSCQGFFRRMEQAEGRVVPDLTITQLNLFHIEELRYGHHNHRPYNLGWGHHHCNVVVKDSGITETLDWMASILRRNIEAGYLEPSNKGS